MAFGPSCIAKSCFSILTLYLESVPPCDPVTMNLLFDLSKCLVIKSLKVTFTMSYFTNGIDIVYS